MLWATISGRQATVWFLAGGLPSMLFGEYINNQNEPPSEKAMKTSQALKQRKVETTCLTRP